MAKSNTVLSVVAIEPMRIGGTEISLRALSEELGKHGWQSVICFLSPPPESVRRFLALPNVRLEVLESSFEAQRRPAAAAGFWRLARRYRPRILHLQYMGFVTPIPLIAKLCGVEKIFYTDHASRPEGFYLCPSPLWKKWAARIINAPITRVIAISNYVARCQRALHYLPQERISVLYDAVDIDRAPPNGAAAACVQGLRRRFAIPPERAIVMQVGWMIPEKGFSDLLRAAREVLAKRNDVQLVLVGEGAGRPQFEQEARELGIADHVTFTGIIDDPMGEGVFAMADVVCQLSRWEEGFGYVIAEAMASGKPVVGARVGAIPELVEDSVTGFLVQLGDWQTAAAEILTLLGDEALRRRLGQAGRESAHARFNLKAVIPELLRMYGISESA